MTFLHGYKKVVADRFYYTILLNVQLFYVVVSVINIKLRVKYQKLIQKKLTVKR